MALGDIGHDLRDDCIVSHSYYFEQLLHAGLIGYPIQEQLRDLFSYLITAVLMGMVVYSVEMLPFYSHCPCSVEIAVDSLYILACAGCSAIGLYELWEEGWNRMRVLRTGSAG